MRETRAVAREERETVFFVVPLPSRAFSHARGHLRVSAVLLHGPRKKETARSLVHPFHRSVATDNRKKFQSLQYSVKTQNWTIIFGIQSRFLKR